MVIVINISESINKTIPRFLRGGAFNWQPAYVRSAVRDRYLPAVRSTFNGFRPSRTYP